MKLAGKYTASLALLLMLGIIKANAQRSNFFTENRKSFYGGFVGGANISTVNGDSYGGYHKVGFNAGGIVYVQFAEHFGTSVSLTYAQKGSRGAQLKYSMYVDSFMEKYYLDLNYVEVPVMLHYFQHPKLHVGVGAAYARLLSSSEELLTDQPVYINPDLYVFNKDEFSGLLQVAYQLGKNLFIDGRYQYSLKPVRDWDKIHVRVGYGAPGQYNGVFSFRLMYLIK
ncbi:MAG: PorT family protein [Sphingobacteriales bacterium]|nr:MAG: PorT family protein [Sphingobacteriales bacterium]